MRRVAVVGNGQVSRQAALAQIEDLFDSLPESTRVILPMTAEGALIPSNVVRWTAEWALDLGVPVEVATNHEDGKFEKVVDDLANDVLDAALKIHTGKTLSKAIIGSLADNDIAVVAWDDADDLSNLIVSRSGVKCLDLTAGMAELVWEDEDEDGDEDEPVQPLPTEDEPAEEADEPAEWPTVYAEAQEEIAEIFKNAAKEASAVLERQMQRAIDRQQKRERRKTNA